MLKNGEILSFEVPKSFTNCIYCLKARTFINEKLQTISDIFECNEVQITQHPTIVI